jgi:transposase InsO family protein
METDSGNSTETDSTIKEAQSTQQHNKAEALDFLRALSSEVEYEKFSHIHEPVIAHLEELMPPIRGAMPLNTFIDPVRTCECGTWHNSTSTCPQYQLPRRAEEDAQGQIMAQRVVRNLLGPQLDKAVDNSKLPSRKKGKLAKLLKEYKDIFRQEGDRTHTCPLFEQAIPLTDPEPVNVRQYDLPRKARDAVKDRVQEFLDAGIIQPSNSGYNSPLWMVPKKDGNWRLCVDYRELNKKLVHDPFPLPKIDELIEEFSGSEYLSSGDLFWGFYHVKIKPEDTHKLAFSTDVGRFEFVHLPMGLKTAPAVFQRLMNLTLDDYLRKFVLVYMDDLIIYSKTEKEHFQHLRKVFQRMRTAGLRLKIEKCAFFQKELKFLGIIVSKEGMRLDPDKIKVVLEFPRPDKDLGQLQSFLGMVGYFRRHIRNYATIARPLFDLLRGEETHKRKRKGTVPTPYKHKEWGPAQEKAFCQLKEAVTSAPVLRYPDFNKPFIVSTDASAYALGFVLSQEFEDGEHPIAFGSQSLKGSERNYGNTDREMLAIIRGVEHFRTYLYGTRFIIRTDHQPISWIDKTKNTSSRVARWMIEMKDYDYDLHYTPAAKIRHADALSRIRHPADNMQLPEEQSFGLWADTRHWNPNVISNQWVEWQRQDPTLSRYLALAKHGNHPQFRISDDILHQKVDNNFVPVAPSQVRTELLYQFHVPPLQGHMGPERTYAKMKAYVAWPGMRQDIYKYIQKCYACQRHKRSYWKMPLQPHFIPPRMFHTITMDIVGPVTPSPFGERYILVIQDLLTRWVEFAPLKQADTVSTVNALMTQWITRYGVPQRILTDRGTNFLSGLAQAFYRSFGIKKVNTTAYRPECNGANERMHAELTKFFSIYLDGYSKSKWRFLLNDARYSYNTAYHTALGMSPYEAVFATEPSLGLLGIPHKDHERGDTFEEYYGMHRKELVQRRRLIQQNLENAQGKARDQANKNSHRIPFQKGDWVMYRNHVPKTKWDPKYLGPYLIIEQLSPVVFDLQVGEGKMAVNAVHLKPYYGEIPPPEPQSTEVPTITPEEEEEGDNYWIKTALPSNQAQGSLSPQSDLTESASESDNENDSNPISQGQSPRNHGQNSANHTTLRASPVRSARRLFKKTAERILELPGLNIAERTKRTIKPPDFFHNSVYSRTRKGF